MMTEDEQYLHDHFLVGIKSGLQSLEDIIDESLDIIEDEGLQSEVSEEWLKETIEQEYAKNEKASQLWNHPTDPDKLLKVFDELCKKKIIALHNAGYTTSDAIYDCQTVWTELEDEGIEPIGYCYYHGQDLERVIRTDKLLIGFHGKHEKNDKEAIIIGNIVSKEFASAGFTINWDGTAASRIEVDFVWNNVFVSDEEVEEAWSYDRVKELMK